jgi:hypothetical protein
MASKRKQYSLRNFHEFHSTASNYVRMSSNHTLPVLGLIPENSVDWNLLNNLS